MTIYTVTFKADNGLQVTVMNGETSPVLTEGFGGWDTVSRPKRVGITRFRGKAPFKQDISVMFDGFADSTPQEYAINTLMRMALEGNDLSEPPKITLGGLALRKDLTWIIDGIDFDNNAIWITSGGVPVRVRQNAVVHLLQYVDDAVITTAASPAVNAQIKKKKTITTPKGMTLKQIALINYKNDVDAGMRLILWANPWLDPDPRKLIPAGTPISIPNEKTNVDKTFIVP